MPRKKAPAKKPAKRAPAKKVVKKKKPKKTIGGRQMDINDMSRMLEHQRLMKRMWK